MNDRLGWEADVHVPYLIFKPKVKLTDHLYFWFHVRSLAAETKTPHQNYDIFYIVICYLKSLHVQ